MDWWEQNKISREPMHESDRVEFARLSDHIRNWHPEFNLGDTVRRRLLGGPAPGRVTAFSWRGTHLCATVDFGSRVETFHVSEYVSC